MALSCLKSVSVKVVDNLYDIKSVLNGLLPQGTVVEFLCIPAHCGIVGNELFSTLDKETLDFVARKKALAVSQIWLKFPDDI